MKIVRLFLILFLATPLSFGTAPDKEIEIYSIPREKVEDFANAPGWAAIGYYDGHVVIEHPESKPKPGRPNDVVVWDGNTIAGLQDLRAGVKMQHPSVDRRILRFIADEFSNDIEAAGLPDPRIWKPKEPENPSNPTPKQQKQYEEAKKQFDRQNTLYAEKGLAPAGSEGYKKQTEKIENYLNDPQNRKKIDQYYEKYLETGASYSHSWNSADRNKVRWFQVPTSLKDTQELKNHVGQYVTPEVGKLTEGNKSWIQNNRCNMFVQHAAPIVNQLVKDRFTELLKKDPKLSEGEKWPTSTNIGDALMLIAGPAPEKRDPLDTIDKIKDVMVAALIPDPHSESDEEPLPGSEGNAKGVRIHFDEAILAEVLQKGTAHENAQLVEVLRRDLAGAKTDQARAGAITAFETKVKLRFRQSRNLHRLDHLAVISLRSLVARAEQHKNNWPDLPDDLRRPGGLTRLHGFVITDDDILIFGRRDPGSPAMDIDDIIVGIRAAWKENNTPIVSLDPDPDHIEGDPHTRIQGIPGNCGFALTMLQADYAMKKIMAGVQTMDVRGYRTLKEILQNNQQTFMSRFWLYPIQPGMGDIQISPDASMAVFSGGVQVLSEEMMLLKEGLVGTGKTFGPAEEAARSFSLHYEAMAAKEPVFRQLQGLFDVVLLGRIWRNRGFTSPLLDRLCALPHRTVEIPPTYKAVRVIVRQEGDMEYYIHGGVQAKIGAGRQSWLTLEDDGLKALRNQCRTISTSHAVSSRVTDVTLEAAVPSTRPDTSSRDFTTAANALLKGELETALTAANRLTKSDPWDSEAFILRALIHLRRADYTRARRDASRARAMDPSDRETEAAASEILFQCRWIEGDPQGALNEMERALRSDANSSHAHVARGDALSQLNRPEDARKAYEKAFQLDPASALACARMAFLELAGGRTLAAKPWIKRAQSLDPNLPEVRIALAAWELATVRPDNAEKIAGEIWEKASVSPTVRLQALAILASVAASREKWERVDDYVAMMDRISIGSPEVLVVAAEIAFTWGERARARRYADKAERLAPRHPMVVELRRKVGR